MPGRHVLLAFLFGVCLVQSAFLAPLVANMKGVNWRATRVLALLMLSFLPSIGEDLINAAGWIPRFPHVLGSSITVDFLIAPLLYFYGRSLMDPDRPFSRRDLLQFVPFVLATLVLVPYLMLSGPEKLEATRNELPASFHLIIAAKIVVAPVYITVIIRQLHRFVTRRDEPRARDPNVVWFYRAIIALAGMAVTSLIVGLLPSTGVQLPIDSDTIGALFICGSIFMLSALLICHPLTAMPGLNGTLAQLVVPAPLRRKYETSPLNEAQKQQYLDRLVRYMEDRKPYLDMSLDLEKLAESIRIRPSHMSQLLNERVGMNFYEFVSSYRVREAQSRIADPAQCEKTLIAIAHESGFNSKASFNRAFKRVTGQTPSEYAGSRLRRNGASPD